MMAYMQEVNGLIHDMGELVRMMLTDNTHPFRKLEEESLKTYSNLAAKILTSLLRQTQTQDPNVAVAVTLENFPEQNRMKTELLALYSSLQEDENTPLQLLHTVLLRLCKERQEDITLPRNTNTLLRLVVCCLVEKEGSFPAAKSMTSPLAQVKWLIRGVLLREITINPDRYLQPINSSSHSSRTSKPVQQLCQFARREDDQGNLLNQSFTAISDVLSLVKKYVNDEV
jgi:hypothetical protein